MVSALGRSGRGPPHSPQRPSCRDSLSAQVYSIYAYSNLEIFSLVMYIVFLIYRTYTGTDHVRKSTTTGRRGRPGAAPRRGSLAQALPRGCGFISAGTRRASRRRVLHVHLAAGNRSRADTARSLS